MNNYTRETLLKSLKEGIRFDGRKLDEYRPINIEVNTSNTAEGSATVTIGDTKMMAGIKLSVGTPYSDTPDAGTLMVDMELTPLASQEFESGPPSIEAIELARVTDRAIRESDSINTKKLCITKGEAVWMVSVDLSPMNAFGNLFDAAALAGVVALKNTKMPELDGDVVNYSKETKKGLPLNELPISVTVIKIGDYLLVDPLPEEESCLDARLTVASLKDGTICAMQKGGEQPLSIEFVDKMVDMSLKAAKDLRKLVG